MGLENKNTIESLINDCTKDVFNVFEVNNITTEKKQVLDSIFHIIYSKGKIDGIDECKKIYENKTP